MKIGKAVFAAMMVVCSVADAQITDPDQRMRWFNLQRLATEVEDIQHCSTLNLNDRRYQEAYYRAATETTAAIESYLSKFPNEGRGKYETTEAYRYRVWHVAITAGKEKARPVKLLTEATCQIILMGR
ncbi:hypothetical protein H8A99_13335 [Bradyrhizobium sp. Arg68]|uniref:hypothetical protein n=1 Tax=Bradyrhizobium ivorense TaxID=2511166 RepID=UPI001E4E2CAC|nr:hypothetical protein [Bradyrhizobium ivorense]MCC8937428.1 hypothetical protein [Bradyrhizobium ivorense]